MAKRVMVTGGSGFVGTNLVETYRRDGVEVVNVDVRAPLNRDHAELWRKADIGTYDELAAVCEQFQPTCVVHLAARTDLRGKSVSDYGANTVGTENVIRAVNEQRSIERVVFASTRLVCRIGYVPRSDTDYAATTPYGESKVVAERAIRAADLPKPWVIVRPTSLWGPWFDVPYRGFFDAIRRGRYVHPAGRRIWKSFSYVENAVNQLDALLEAPDSLINGRTMYLADPPIEIYDLALRVQAAFDAPRVRSVPVAALRVLALMGDAARAAGWAEPPLTSFRLNNLLTQMVYDAEPIAEIANRPAVGLDDAVARTVAWMRDTAPARA
jgi:nucleoside-diphosphate-sugar epimerase